MSESVRGLRLAAVVCALVVAIDQGTKAAVRAGVERGDAIELLPFLDLVNSRNRGIAFGLADGASPLLIAATVLVVALLFAFLVRRAGGMAIWVAGGLLLGGALANLADRVRDDAVTDFIDLSVWPTFNLADVAIVAGALTLAFAHGPGPSRAGR